MVDTYNQISYLVFQNLMVNAIQALKYAMI